MTDKCASTGIASPRFSQADLLALATIKKITRTGNNAEVKEKDGQLIVYDVKKQKAM